MSPCLASTSSALTEPEEIETWLTAPWAAAKTLQRPLPDGSLDIVACGVKKDGVKKDGEDGEAERPAQRMLI